MWVSRKNLTVCKNRSTNKTSKLNIYKELTECNTAGKEVISNSRLGLRNILSLPSSHSFLFHNHSFYLRPLEGSGGGCSRENIDSNERVAVMEWAHEVQQLTAAAQGAAGRKL